MARVTIATVAMSGHAPRKEPSTGAVKVAMLSKASQTGAIATSVTRVDCNFRYND